MSDASPTPPTSYSFPPSAFPSQNPSTSANFHRHSHHPQSSHPNLPPPPPPDRKPPPKGRITHQNGHQRFRLMRKGKDKDKEQERAEEDEDWTLEGSTANGHARNGAELLQPQEELLFDSELTELPPRKDEKERKRSKGRGLAKKTSRLFLRGTDKERSGEGSSSGAITPDSVSSLNMPAGSRQASYSSVTSSETNGPTRRHFPALNRPFSHNSASSAKSANQSPRSSHSRRLSQESQGSRQTAARSVRSGSVSTHTSPTHGHQLIVPQRQSSHLGASAPSLSLHALPQPASSSTDSNSANSARNGDTFPTRLSTWFSHLLPSSSSTAVAESSNSPSTSDAPTAVPPSPQRKPPSAAASFLSAARQRAVDGVRHLLDSEAQPDKCPDTMWVLGVAHPGWKPSTPGRSPSQQVVDLPEVSESERRGSGSSGKPSPPPAGALRPTAWSKWKDPSAPTSPPSKGLSNLFSTSTLSLALPASVAGGSPSKDSEARNGTADSPNKAKNRKAEKEVVKWPDDFYDDFRSRIWCTYRSQYAPILSIPKDLLIPRADAYYAAFGPPSDIVNSPPPGDSLAAASMPNRPPPSSWSWTRSADERGLTSDAGWGCMLRTGQSMLANALIHLHLGRAWRLPQEQPSNEPRNPTDLADLEAYESYVRVLSWFLDDPSPLCPFSVHRMALVGKELGKEVGEWFGPSTASGALKTLANSFPPSRLAVATATDSMVYESDVCAASNLISDGWAEDREHSGKARRTTATRHAAWGSKAVLILIGIRLGLDGVNPIYHESVKMLFTFPQSVGIAGGRPSSSYYFVASQANSLFYLDPHITRPALPLEVPPSAPPAGASDDADEGVVVVLPLDRDSPVNVPYTLDVVDVDDLSDGSDASSSPTTRIRGQQRSTAAARLLSFPPGTPPSTRTRPSPDTPSTPFNSSDPLGHETPTGPGLSPAGPSRLAVDPQTLWYANAYSEAQLHTFHCEKVKKMPLSGLDPSMLLGFLCRDEADFADFRERVSKLPQKIFTVQEEPPTWDDDDAAGLESVSEPELDDLVDNIGRESPDDDEVYEGNITVEAVNNASRSLGMPRVRDEEEEWETKLERGTTPSGQPTRVVAPLSDIGKERPAVAGRTRTESWVQTGREGQEAPNGGSVVQHS